MTEQASDPLELTCGCQAPGMGDGCLEANSGPVQEQYILLITELFLQPYS